MKIKKQLLYQGKINAQRAQMINLPTILNETTAWYFTQTRLNEKTFYIL